MRAKEAGRGLIQALRGEERVESARLGSAAANITDHFENKLRRRGTQP